VPLDLNISGISRVLRRVIVSLTEEGVLYFEPRLTERFGQGGSTRMRLKLAAVGGAGGRVVSEKVDPGGMKNDLVDVPDLMAMLCVADVSL
jgi:hypothetical protein